MTLPLTESLKALYTGIGADYIPDTTDSESTKSIQNFAMAVDPTFSTYDMVCGGTYSEVEEDSGRNLSPDEITTGS